MDHDIPLPPPGAIPLPPSDTPQLYSPSQNSPTAYSPSRATSPSSDTDEKSSSASRKPGAVLGKGQAKSRLRAFMQSQISNSPKRRVASVFNEDDEEGTKKMRPVVKQATPVMDQLMKDELREKNKAIEIVQEANRKREDSMLEASKKREEDLKEANRKREEDLKKIQDNKDLDLREILKRKKEREVVDKREEEREKRSRSRGKERSPDRKRGRRSPERRKSQEGWKSPERRKSPDIKTPDAKKKIQSSAEKSKSSGEKEERRVSRRSRTPERGSRSGRSEDKRERKGDRRSRTLEKLSPWPSLDYVSSVPRSWAGLKRSEIDVRNPEFRELMGRCGDKEEKLLRECETVMVVMATNEDFKEVKGSDRALSDGGHDIEKMEVPKKYIKSTSDGVIFSFNKASNELLEKRKYQQRYDFYEKMDKHEMDESEFENMRKILEGDKTPPQELFEEESGTDVAWYPEEKKWKLESESTVERAELRKLRSSVDDFVNELAMGAEDVSRSAEKKTKKYSNPEIAALKKQIKDLERDTKKKHKKKSKLENDDGSAKKSKKKKKEKSKEKKEKKKKKKEKKSKRDLEEEDPKVADESMDLPLETDIFADEQLGEKRSRSGGDAYEIDSPSPPKPNLDKQQAKLLSMAGYGGEPLENRSPKKRREGSESPKRSRKSRKLSPAEGLAEIRKESPDKGKGIGHKKLSPSPSRKKTDSRMCDGTEKKQAEQSRELSPFDKHIRSFDDTNLESLPKKETTPSKPKDHPLDYDNRPSSHNSRSEDILATSHLDSLVPAGASDMSDSIDTSFGTPVRDEGRALKEEATKRSLHAESPRPSSRSKRSVSPARPGARGPRTPSPSPRLPKMTDRRSPSTSIAPVMRDQRSPVRRQGSPGWRNDSYSGEDKHARPQSPGTRAIVGKSPGGSRDGHSPRKSPGRARRGLSPGAKISPGISPGFRGSPGRSVASRSPVKPASNRSPGRSMNRSPGRARTPPGRSPSSGSRKRSPGRPYTPERRIPSSPGRGYRSPSPRGARRFSPGRKSPSPGRRPHSPGRRPPSPGKRPHSPGRRPPSPGRRPLSPGRRPLSPGRRPLSPGRRPLSPGRRSMSPGRRSPGRRRSPSPPYRRRSPRRGRSPSPFSRRFRSPSPGRRYSPSRRRAPPSPGRGHMSPDRRLLSPGRRQLSPGRRPLSPGRRPGSPGRRPLSPGRRPLSPGRRPMSPGRRPMSPGRRPMSPGRRPLSPGRPGWRPPSPGRRLSPGRRHSPGRRPISPGRRATSPGRRGISPRGRPYSPDKRPPSPGQGCPADSTISDADLATQMLPPSAAHHHRSSHYHTTHADSPKRPSLDERLERELGIKVAREEPPLPDFRVPPPGFPGAAKGAAPFPAFGHPGAPQVIPPGQTPPRYGLPAAGMAPSLGATPPVRPGSNLHAPATPQPQAASPKVPLSTGLPAKIPTYNDSHSDKVESSNASRPPYPGTRSEQVAQEREQASKAAESVAAKLQEMQAAKEEERRKKREARMAERMALMEPATEVTKEEKIEPKGSKVASGPRILEALEKKEVEVKMDEDIRKKEELEMKKESVDFETPVKEKRSKKKGDPDTPTLITLKPFYRPESKKEKKTKKVSPPAPTFPDSPEEEAEEFVKKEPVPLPDNSVCKPVLVKLGFSIARDQNGFTAAPRDKKLVKFVDGVLPGQGSPDISTDSPTATPAEPEKEKTTTKKKWKKVRITVVTRVTGDTDSEDESPPPPPPGSPPRYHTSQLIQMYGKPRLMTPTKA